MATTLCLINQKGGCGKSSTCFHVGGRLAADGDRVLLVDADPQGSLSQGFFGSASVERLEADQTLAALFERGAQLGRLATPTSVENLDLVRSNHRLAVHNAPAPESLGLRQFALQNLLADAVNYDWVLIDCPPNLFACSWNALLASDYVLIPVPPEDFGTQGLRAVHEAIRSARRLSPKLARLGHLVTRRDSRLLIHRAYEQKLRDLYDDVFETIVPEAAAFKVALTCRQPVTQNDPSSKAADSISRLSDELRRRVRASSLRTRVA